MPVKPVRACAWCQAPVKFHDAIEMDTDVFNEFEGVYEVEQVCRPCAEKSNRPQIV